jgi:hypothetical protein
MKTGIASWLTALLLLAPTALQAAETTVFAKAGASAADVQREISACEALAANISYAQETGYDQPETASNPGAGGSLVMLAILPAVNKQIRDRHVEICMRNRGYPRIALAPGEAKVLAAQKTEEARAAWLGDFLASSDIGRRVQAAVTQRVSALPVAQDLNDPFVIGAARVDPNSLKLTLGPIGDKGELLTGKVQRRSVALLQEDFKGHMGVVGISAAAGTEFQEYHAPPPWDASLSDDLTAWCAKFKTRLNVMLCFRTRLTGYSLTPTGLGQPWMVGFVSAEPFSSEEGAFHSFLPLKVLQTDPQGPLELHMTLALIKPDWTRLTARVMKDGKSVTIWSGVARFDSGGRANFPFWDRTLALTRADADTVTAAFEPRTDGKGWHDVPVAVPR